MRCEVCSKITFYRCVNMNNTVATFIVKSYLYGKNHYFTIISETPENGQKHVLLNFLGNL